MTESTLTVHEEQPKRGRPQQPKRAAITGQRRPAWMPKQRQHPAVPFGLHIDPHNQAQKDAEMALKKRRIAQEEIQESATSLVKSTLGQLASSDEHNKKFRKEIDESRAFPELLKSHLGFVNELPETLQLAALVGGKWLRTRFAQ